MSNLKIDTSKFSLSTLKDYISIVAILVLLGIFGAINPNFLGMRNLSNILGDMSALMAMGIGVTFILLIGSIDLSVGAVSSISCVVFAISVGSLGWGAYPLALCTGILTGIVSGVLFVKVKIPSFIATFGTMSIWMSVALLLSKGSPQQIVRTNWQYMEWYKIKISFIPLPFILVSCVLLLLLVVEKRTKFGRTLYAIGGNESAARMAGLPVDKTKILVFVAAGFFASFAGIFFACNLKSGIPTVGEPFTLMAIAAVALGGTSLSGGKGGLLKTFAGAILVTLIQNGMNVIGVSAFWQQVTFGVIVLAAVYLTTDRKRRNLVIK